MLQAAGTEDEHEWLEAGLNLIRGELGIEAYTGAIQHVASDLEGVFVLDEHRGGPRWRR